MVDNYYLWLVGLIDNGHVRDYSILLEYLHHDQFTWVLAKDENRAVDGAYMRYTYSCETGLEASKYAEESCTILEMLVALSKRCAEDVIGDLDGTGTIRWFWKVLHNLHLDILDDTNWREDLYYEIIDRWMKREFEPDGTGSLYPLREYSLRDMPDQRYQDIWLQMNAYLIENDK